MKNMSTEVNFLDPKFNVVSEKEAKWKVTATYNDKGILEKEVWVDLKAKSD